MHKPVVSLAQGMYHTMEISEVWQNGVAATVNALIGQFADNLSVQQAHLYDAMKGNADAQFELSALLAKRTINRLGVEAFDKTLKIYEGKGDMAETENWIQEGVEEEVTHWRKTNRTGYHRIIDCGVFQETDDTQEDAMRAEWEKKMALLNAQWRIRYPSGTREFFAKVRQATYREMEPDDAFQISEIHNARLLDRKVLELIKDRQAPDAVEKNIDLFREKLRKGLFDRPMNYQKLAEDLKKKDPHKLQLVGRILESDGKVLAWDTWLQTPLHPDDSVREHIHRYLKHGETGGKMRYAHIADMGAGAMQQYLMERWQNIQLFGTIHGLYPFAANKLFALTAEEMRHRDHLQSHLILDRLGSFTISPDFTLSKLLGVYWNTPQNNANNQLFFIPRRFRDIATDSDKKNPNAVNVGVIDGRERIINPSWIVSRGDMRDVIPASMKLWREEQIRHADLSPDTYEENKINPILSEGSK